MKIFFDTNFYVAEALLGEVAEEMLAATERASWRIYAFLFDTHHLTLYQHKHPPLMQRFAQPPADSVAIYQINIEEVIRGRLAPLGRVLSGAPRPKAAWSNTRIRHPTSGPKAA
jgi:hypothetical protein